DLVLAYRAGAHQGSAHPVAEKCDGVALEAKTLIAIEEQLLVVAGQHVLARKHEEWQAKLLGGAAQPLGLPIVDVGAKQAVQRITAMNPLEELACEFIDTPPARREARVVARALV